MLFLISEKQTQHHIQIWHSNGLHKNLIFKILIHKQKNAVPKKLANVL